MTLQRGKFAPGGTNVYKCASKLKCVFSAAVKGAPHVLWSEHMMLRALLSQYSVLGKAPSSLMLIECKHFTGENLHSSGL